MEVITVIDVITVQRQKKLIPLPRGAKNTKKIALRRLNYGGAYALQLV